MKNVRSEFSKRPLRALALVLRGRWLGIYQSWIDPGAAAGGEGDVAGVVACPSVAGAARAGCQSASDRDPRSASNRDPFVLRFERLALASSELVGVAETGRARVVG